MIDIAKTSLAQAPEVARIEVQELNEYAEPSLSMTTHMLVVVEGTIKAIGEDEHEREIALVIPRKHCVGNKPTAQALLHAACDSLMHYMMRKPARCLEMMIRTPEGLMHRLLRVHTHPAMVG